MNTLDILTDIFTYVIGWLLSARVALWALRKSNRLQHEFDYYYIDGQWKKGKRTYHGDKTYTPFNVPGVVLGWAIIYPLIATLLLIIGSGWGAYRTCRAIVATPIHLPTRSTRRLGRARTAAEITEKITLLEKELEL